MKYITLLLAMVVILTSCRKDYDQRLLAIDAVMEEKPDSAYSALKEMDKDVLSDYNLPYYALLYTQAQVKCGVTVTSDSLFHYAYDHYSHQSSGDLKKRAHFYNAEIAFQNRNYQSAMRDALTSYTMAKSANDYYWWAKSAEMISDIFHFVFNEKEALPYQIEAVENYKKAGKILNHRYAVCDLATSYLGLNRNKEALALIDSIRSVVLNEQPLDTKLLDYANTNLPLAYYRNSHKKELEDILTQFSDSLKEDLNFLYIKGKIYLNDHLTDSVMKVITCAQNIASDDQEVLKVKYLQYLNSMNKEDYKSAALYIDSILKIQNKIINKVVKESVVSVQRDYYSDASMLQEKQTKHFKLLLIIVSVFSIIITLLIIIIYRLKLRAKRSQLENIATSILSLKEELIRRDEKVDVLQKQINESRESNSKNLSIIENLFMEKWDTLNMLCKQYIEVGNTDKGRLYILNNIDKELKKFRTRKSLKEIEKAVDNYRDGIISKLREECTFLTEDEITLMTLIYAGFSSRAICLFMDFKYKFFYLKKGRIIKKIENSEVSDKDLFIAKIG